MGRMDHASMTLTPEWPFIQPIQKYRKKSHIIGKCELARNPMSVPEHTTQTAVIAAIAVIIFDFQFLLIDCYITKHAETNYSPVMKSVIALLLRALHLLHLPSLPRCDAGLFGYVTQSSQMNDGISGRKSSHVPCLSEHGYPDRSPGT